MQVIVFKVGDINLAVPISQIIEITPIKKLTKLPGDDKSILGVSSVREKTTTIYSISNILDLGEMNELKYFIILNSDKNSAIACCNVPIALTIDESQINQTISNNELIIGVCSHQEMILNVLNLDKLCKMRN